MQKYKKNGMKKRIATIIYLIRKKNLYINMNHSIVLSLNGTRGGVGSVDE